MEHNNEVSFFKGGKESVLGRFAAESVGPFRSFLTWSAYKVSGGRIRPDLEQFFGETEANNLPVVEISQASEILEDIDNRLSDRNGIAENFIGSDFLQWTSLKEEFNKVLGPKAQVFDYVLFSQEGDYLFLKSESKLIPVKIGPNEFRLGHPMRIPVSDKNDELGQLVSTEIAINGFAREQNIDLAIVEVERMSSVTNKFPCFRHETFEREGEMFTDLRHKGVWSLGELQALNQTLFSKGISFDAKLREVMIDKDLAHVWLQIRDLSREGTSKWSEAESEMWKFAKEKIYFEVVGTFFKENPEIVDRLMQSGAYAQFKMPFIDKNLSALGLTERGVAEAMLSNYYLSVFEGGKVSESPTQTYLARIPGFHESLANFISSNRDVTRPSTEISTLFSQLKKKDYSFTRARIDAESKTNLINAARDALILAKNQIERRKFDLSVSSKLEKAGVIVSKKGLFTTAVSNLALARVPGEKKFAMSSWFPWTDDYLSSGKPLPDVGLTEHEPTGNEVAEAVKNIFSGRIESGKSAYDSQEDRILKSASVLLAYLQESDAIPDNVKQFMKTLTSNDLAVRILERLGPISDNDPLTVNRFFPDGFSGFQKSATYRYIFDFVRGVETNIVLQKSKSTIEKGQRKFGGVWKNYDFSGAREIDVQIAVAKTLEDASHRIKILNHEAGVKRKTFSDYQDFFEKVFGWDTFDMKFMRWEKFWNVWETLGPTWDCICFSRKTIFNPRVLQQW